MYWNIEFKQVIRDIGSHPPNKKNRWFLVGRVAIVLVSIRYQRFLLAWQNPDRLSVVVQRSRRGMPRQLAGIAPLYH